MYFVTKLLTRVYLEKNVIHSEGKPETTTSRTADRIREEREE